MSRSDTPARWRPVLAILIAVPSMAACAGTAPSAVPSASAVAAAASPRAASPNATLSPPPTRSAAPDPYDGIAVVEVEAETTLFLERDIGYLGVTADAVWVATSGGLATIDPTSGIGRDVDETGRFGLAAARHAVWVSDFQKGTVSRFGSAKVTPVVSVAVSGNPNAIAVFGDSVWVAQHRGGSVTRLDELSGKVAALIEVGPVGSSGPQGIAAGEDAIWVGIPNSRSVVRIDPATNAVVATIKTTVSPCGGIALAPDAVWVSTCFDDHKAIRIDPRTNTLVAEIDIGGRNGGPVLVDGYPWFPVYNQLVRIDPATNRIDRIVKFAPSAEFAAFGTTIGFDSVWIGAQTGRVSRIPIATPSQ